MKRDTNPSKLVKKNQHRKNVEKLKLDSKNLLKIDSPTFETRYLKLTYLALIEDHDLNFTTS